MLQIIPQYLHNQKQLFPLFIKTDWYIYAALEL